MDSVLQMLSAAPCGVVSPMMTAAFSRVPHAKLCSDLSAYQCSGKPAFVAASRRRAVLLGQKEAGLPCVPQSVFQTLHRGCDAGGDQCLPLNGSWSSHSSCVQPCTVGCLR